jgi:hypothetical protein
MHVRGRATVALIVATLVCAAGTAPAADLSIDAPPSLAVTADRIRAMDLPRLEGDLARAGLALPDRIDVTLVSEDDPRASTIPRWIVGLALGEQDIVIFPQRVLPYPYDSVDSVFRHEVAHLALASRAGGQPLPRWFHEGVAMSVDAGWGMSGQLRLLFGMARSPGTADLARLFASELEPDTSLAYGLSAALVADLQRRHGPAIPGAIAARVADGIPFPRAFSEETSETPDEAAAQAWSTYRRWTAWVAALTDGSAIWTAIMIISGIAFIAVRRRRAKRRRQWEEEEEEGE